jgi:hypothetical protein
MVRRRLLVWLIALVMLVAPPGMVAHAMSPADAATAVDCPGHAPPPPCPDEGTAKHAASTCCPLMAGAVAMLLPAVDIEPPARSGLPPAAAGDTLAGRTLTEEPPPPRA